MKNLLIFLISLIVHYTANAQYQFKGRVMSDESSAGIADVHLLTKEGNLLSITNAEGVFTFTSSIPKLNVVFTKVGYQTKAIQIENSLDSLWIFLRTEVNELAEIQISTGYGNIPKDRATGSFTQINSELLNRSVSTDIISRLEGVTSSLQFDRRKIDNRINSNLFRELRIRGISTINSDMSPLIVIDNFPYEGDLESINPNDVENITILKDAAAASIWGARAGNGVIVITTKRGKYRQPITVNLNNNISIQERPDLYYNPRYIPPSAFIKVERQLFEQNFYNSQISSPNQTPLSPVVELLKLHRDGIIGNEELEERLLEASSYDIRKDAKQYLYRTSVNQQYAVSINGGSENSLYRVSAGYDDNVSELKGDEYNRFTFSTNLSTQVSNKWEFNTSIYYTNSKVDNNGISIQSLIPVGKNAIYPYARLVDLDGNLLPLPMKHRNSYTENVESKGLLNWDYIPLNEISLGNNSITTNESRISLAVKYAISPSLSINIQYQYQNKSRSNIDLRKKETYYVRDLVNRFTQPNGELAFPNADILSREYLEQIGHNSRFQLDYQKYIGAKGNLNLLSGAELRENIAKSNGFTVYGYDNDVLTYNNQLDFRTLFITQPSGTSRIPFPDFPMSYLLDRYISYFANTSYEHDRKYIISGSLRWDASNLFGVKTNQKGVPLWSTGVLWKLSDESFYQSHILSRLILRLTYGFNGNVNRSASAFPTLAYRNDLLTGYKVVYVRNPGDPNLRWEKIGVFNAALDFGIKDKIISGTIDYYLKNSRDLLGLPLLDPTVGYKPADPWMQPLYNYATMKTQGIDMEIKVSNLRRRLIWDTQYIVNFVTNKVTHYENLGSSNISAFTLNYGTPPVVGKSLDAIHSLPWAGLDPNTGDPLVNMEGSLVKAYTQYLSTLTIDEMIYGGVTFPKLQGALRNTLGYNNFKFSFNIMFKGGFVFRRSSISYSDFFNSWSGHRDFLDRWQKQGDELHTQVPSMPSGNIANRDAIYTLSTALVERGEHIRFQDVNISFTIPKLPVKGTRSARLYCYASNLGIIWRANKHKLDPDYPSAAIRPGKSISIGLQINL